MTASDKLFSSKLSVSVDFGQPTKVLGGASETYIKDDNGKAMEFNSIAHALNFMASYGYKLEQTYTAQVRDDLEVVHYVMRRE